MDTTLPAIANNYLFLPVEFLSGNLVTRCTNEIAELQTADELIEKGHAERKGKRFRQALELYEKALTVDPCHELGLFWAGYSLLPFKDWSAIIDELYGKQWRLAVNRSIGYYQKLINLKEQNKDMTRMTLSSCYVNLGVGYNLLDNKSKAEEWWQKAIDFDGDALGYCYLGSLRKKMDRIDEAIVLLNKAIAKNGKYALPYYYLGKIRMNRNERDLALRCFRCYLEYIDRKDPWEKECISFADDYVEIHSPPSEMRLKAAEQSWKTKEAKMENPVKNDKPSGPGTAIESGIPHTVADEKELYELFLTCWDQSVASPSYKKSTWKEMREFFWRFGWRI
jgi:tetratricopeptide (TPR) repeat protein